MRPAREAQQSNDAEPAETEDSPTESHIDDELIETLAADPFGDAASESGNALGLSDDESDSSCRAELQQDPSELDRSFEQLANDDNLQRQAVWPRTAPPDEISRLRLEGLLPRRKGEKPIAPNPATAPSSNIHTDRRKKARPKGLTYKTNPDRKRKSRTRVKEAGGSGCKEVRSVSFEAMFMKFANE